MLSVVENHLHFFSRRDSKTSHGTKLVIRIMPAEVSAAGFVGIDEFGTIGGFEWSFLLKIANPSRNHAVIKGVYVNSEGKGGSLRSEPGFTEVYEVDPKKVDLSDKRPVNSRDYSAALPLIVKPGSSIMIRVHVTQHTFNKKFGIFRVATTIPKEKAVDSDTYSKFKMRDKIIIDTNMGKAIIYTAATWRFSKLASLFNKMRKVQTIGGR